MLQLPRQSKVTPRLIVYGWMVVGALPLAYIAMRVIAASRNIVFWDEFDTALALILRINDGAGWGELLQRFFAINNEHRMVTSRLLFALSYWLTGTVNFHVIGAIGNLFMLGACAWLVAATIGTERRVRLGVILAFVMFQLEQFENFLWSGASIDHFQVVMLGVGAIAALVSGSRLGVSGAALLGVMATFTLAHGTLVWPVGALLLLQQRRWNHLTAWLAVGAVTAVLFLQGFELNPAHHVAGEGGALQTLSRVAAYWLSLLGGPLTLGKADYALMPGLVLLGGLGFLAARGAAAREPLAFFCALFAVSALALVAFGRSELAGPEINSRYLVLGTLAWSLLLFMALELWTDEARPYRLLLFLLPALAAFNVAANVRYAPLAEGYIEVRDRAATSFMHWGEDGRGLVRLHPRERHADVILRMAEDRGIYTLPPVSHVVTRPKAVPSQRIIAHADQFLVNERAVTIGGWAMIPGVTARRGQIHVLLRSPTTQRIYTTVTLQRPDVAKAYQEPRWRLAGFRAVIDRDELPAEDFEVGVLVDAPTGPEFLLLPHQLRLAPRASSDVPVSGAP